MDGSSKVPKRSTTQSFFNQNSRKRTKSSPSPFAHGSVESRRDRIDASIPASRQRKEVGRNVSII